MIAPTRSDSPSPCGCGGTRASASSASSASSSGCGCGCGGRCGTDCRDGAIVRPLFFAGQLLTEEDLQALSDYTGAKSRLHNRNLFGEGVACGFEVVCHPCGGGKVTVRPGHALDCCGNDIVLSTAQTLDVNALVRELRKTLQGGIDCGDPCADPSQNGGRQHYSLFVRYCESLTDPVSAFLTDEPCGTTACEPTRVREGLRFELRCRGKADPPEDALCRIAHCLGDPAKLKAVLADLTTLDHVIQMSEEGLELERRGGDYTAEAMKKATDALVAATTKPDPLTGRETRDLVTRIDVVRVHLDRFNKISPPPVTVPPEITAAGKALDTAAPKVISNLATGAPADLEKSFFRKVVELAEFAINKADRTQRDLWPINSVPELGLQLDELLCSLLGRLRDRLAGSIDVTACHLHLDVRDIGIRCPAQNPPLDLKTAIDQARRLRTAWWHALQDCICPPLLPPCTECHDPGVLLASLEVEKCEVVRICNLDRTLLPTPAAIRHWLPLHLLQQLAAALCCRDLGQLDLKGLLDSLCPSTEDLATLASAFGQLRDLVLDHEPAGLRLLGSGGQTLLMAPFAEAAPVPVAALALEAAEPSADVLRLETAQQKNAADLESLRRDLEEQKAALDKRLKALEGKETKEGRKKP